MVPLPPPPDVAPDARAPSPPGGGPHWAPYTAVLALLAALIGAALGGVVVVIVVAIAGGDTGDLSPAGVLAASAVQEVAFVGAAIMFASIAGTPRPWHFGLRRPARPGRAALFVVGAYLVTLAFSAIWLALIDVSQKDELPSELGADKSSWARAGTAILVCLLAPVAEEFLFRGYIFAALRTWRGPLTAAVTTGCLFGFVHVVSAPIGYLVPLAVLGILLCLIYERTKSLYPCIALHALNNCVAFGVGVGWGWQVPILIAGTLATLGVAARAVERRGGAPALA